MKATLLTLVFFVSAQGMAPTTTQSAAAQTIQLVEVSRTALPSDADIIGAATSSDTLLLWSGSPEVVYRLAGGDLDLFRQPFNERILAVGLREAQLEIVHPFGMSRVDTAGNWSRRCAFSQEVRTAVLAAQAWHVRQDNFFGSESKQGSCRFLPISDTPRDSLLHLTPFGNGYVGTQLRYPFKAWSDDGIKHVHYDPLSLIEDVDSTELRDSWVSLPIIRLNDSFAIQTLVDLRSDLRKIVLYGEHVPIRVTNHVIPIGLIAAERANNFVYGLLRTDDQQTVIRYRWQIL